MVGECIWYRIVLTSYIKYKSKQKMSQDGNLGEGGMRNFHVQFMDFDSL